MTPDTLNQTRRERDYIERTIATVRNHRDADNCWPQWANIFADEIEDLWSLLEQRTQERDEALRWLETACDDRDIAEERVRELEAALWRIATGAESNPAHEVAEVAREALRVGDLA